MRSSADTQGAGVLRRLAPSIYIPTVLESAGESALLPVLPILALHLGFSPAGAAALTVIAGIGAVVGPIPVGRLMLAVGARRAIIVSGLVLVAADVAALVLLGGLGPAGADTGHRLLLIGLLVVMAATSQVWSLGRQSYLGSELPPALRARGMTTFGGMLRIGQVVGPMLGAGVTALGHEAWVFGLFAAMTLTATVMVASFMVPGESAASNTAVAVQAAEHAPDPEGFTGELTEAIEEAPAPDTPAAREVLSRMLRLGLGIAPVMMGRINRPVIVPLLGALLGLDAPTVSIIFGLAAVLEILMFVPAGSIMDRWGRAAVAVPCSLLMGAGYVLLAIGVPVLGHGSHLQLTLVLLVPCLLIALGNGLGSGIIMTLGVDVSPEQGRTRYLAWWNTVIGVGRLTAPLLVSAVSLVAPVSVAAAISGALCLAGAVQLAHVLPVLTPPGYSRQRSAPASTSP